MLYIDFLKTVSECPFCKTIPNQVVKENSLAFLACALAPYAPYHLLAIPKRHATDYLELTVEERDAIDALVADGVRALEKLGIDDYSVMVRVGNNKSIGKSVDHIHFHIVPKARLGTLDANGDDRVILSPDELLSIVEKTRDIVG